MGDHLVIIFDAIGPELREFDDKGTAINYADLLGGYYIDYKSRTNIILEEMEDRRKRAINKMVDLYETKKSKHIVMTWKDLE